MPRLFTGLEVPREAADALALVRGGLHGARWIDRENYHVTLRFIGDVDGATAREVASLLGEAKPRAPLALRIEALASFGNDRPRALIARLRPGEDLLRLQAEHEKLVRRAGLDPETRKFVPHVTLARLRGVTASEVAGFLATRGHFPPLAFAASRFVLYSARDSVGGGPYVVEAAYPFRDGVARPADPGRPLEAGPA